MKLIQFIEHERNTIYVLSEGRKSDPMEWLRKQEADHPADWSKFDRRINLLAKNGLTGNEQHFRFIRQFDIWEIKAGALRMLCFEEEHSIFILVAGFRKPNPKEQRNEFRRAADLRSSYLIDRAKGQNEVCLKPGERLFARIPKHAVRSDRERNDGI